MNTQTPSKHLQLIGLLAPTSAILLALIIPLWQYADTTTTHGQFFVTNKSQFAPLYALLSAQGPANGLIILLLGSVCYTFVALLYHTILTRVRCYPDCIPALWKSRLHWFLLIVVWGGFLAAYPLLSDDVLDYLIQARLASHYGVNPYVPESQHIAQADAWHAMLSSSAHRSSLTYGPLWFALSLGIVSLAGSSLPVALLGIKAVMACLLLLCGSVIWLLYDQDKPAERRLRVLALVWHPFLWLEVLWSGHNDIVMMLWVLLALLALHRKAYVLAFALLTCGIATKYIPIIFVPLFLAAYLRDEKRPLLWRRLAYITAVSGILGIAIYAPLVYNSGLAFFSGLATHAAKTNPSVGAYLQLFGSNLFGEQIARLITPALLLALVAWLSWRVWNGMALIDALVPLALVYVLLLSPWLVPWYGIWVIMLTLTSRVWLHRSVLSTLLILPAYYLVNALPFPDWFRIFIVAGIPLLVVYRSYRKEKRTGSKLLS